MNRFSAITWAFLALSCIALGCGDTSSATNAGTTAAECVRGDLVSQCPPNTMPELSANSEAICSSSGEGSADAVSGMGRVENVCAGSGSCQLVCRLINPCDFGVERVSESEGVVCRIPGGCGDDICEMGEDPTSCPQDCEGDCTALSSRCVDGQIQRCALNGVFEDPQSCLDEEVCREDGDAAQCVPAACGDSVIQEGMEQCDDGNTITEPCAYGVESCTVCNAMCMEVAGEAAFCGDSIVQEGEEECDDGDAIQSPCPYNETSCTVCDAQCNFVPGEVGSICGDEVLDESNGEACDKGEFSVTENGSCPFCQDAVCGDAHTYSVDDEGAPLSITDPNFEACDDGNDVDFNDGCNTRCQVTEVDGPLNVDCDTGATTDVCPLNRCAIGFSCVARDTVTRNEGSRDEITFDSENGQCQKNQELKFSGVDQNGNKVAKVQGTLITDARDGGRDADIFTYEQRCGFPDDPLYNEAACVGENEAQYLFVLDFDIPPPAEANANDVPSFGPSIIENTCNGYANDFGQSWSTCLCRRWHPLCAANIGERKRAFWCVSATEVGDYTVRIGDGKDNGWPNSTISYSLTITEMLNQSGCEEYVPEDDELCVEDNSTDI